MTGSHSREEIKRAGIEGVRWLGAARALVEVAGLGGTVVLARLIPPAEFGYYAVVAILFMLAGSLAGDGVTAPLVRLGEIGRGHLEGAAFLALAAGGAATLAVLVLAPLSDSIFGDEIARLLQIASPFPLLAAIGAVSRAQLQRRLAFRRLGVIDAVASLSGLATTIVLAVVGLDAEALILGGLAAQALAVALLVASAPPPRPRRTRELARIREFGLPNAAAGVASTLAQNVDYAILAARASPATVGFYWRGYQLGVETQRKLSGVLAGLALPLYARSADRGEQLALRSRFVRLQTILITPLLVVLIVLAPILVPAIFGERWEPTVVPTQLLAIAGLLAAAQTGTGPLIAAMGRPGAMLRWNLTNIVVLGVAVFIVAPHGLIAISLTVLGYRIIRFLASYEFLLRRIAGVPLRGLIHDLSPALCSGALSLGAAYLGQWIAFDGFTDWVEVIATAAVVAIVYPLTLRALFGAAFREMRSALAALARRAPVAEVGAPA